MIKHLDGDTTCNRRWKKLEIISSNASIVFKDDHLSGGGGGQWQDPKDVGNQKLD